MVHGPFLFSDSRLGDVDGYVLENEHISMTVLTLGGIIQKLIYKGKDIVCGFDDANSYLDSTNYYGALIGRYCNRLEHLVINGTEYPITKSENGTNLLHGGKVGFDKKFWRITPHEDALELYMHADDGEEGFPGNIDVMVTYTLKESELIISYRAVSDKDTAVNLTNHTYFNLDGIGGNVLKQKLYIPAYYISECDELHVPTGEHLPCWDGPLDFNQAKEIGRDIKKEHSYITPYGGYDSNFVLRKESGKMTLAARAESSEIVLEVLTDLPCIQIYTSNESPKPPMKYGLPQVRHRGFCVETQFEPNAVNFDGAYLKAGEVLETTTIFRLSPVIEERN